MAAALVGVLVAVRLVGDVASGPTEGSTLRSYAFWALVCLPVASVADQILRTAAEYQRLALARIRNRRD